MTATNHRPNVNELVDALPKHEGLGHTADNVSDLLMDLEDILYADVYTGPAADVVVFIDAAIKGLDVLRDAAVQEHRRRADAAMARSAELLGSCVCPANDTLAICPEHGYHGENDEEATR